MLKFQTYKIILETSETSNKNWNYKGMDMSYHKKDTEKTYGLEFQIPQNHKGKFILKRVTITPSLQYHGQQDIKMWQRKLCNMLDREYQIGNFDDVKKVSFQYVTKVSLIYLRSYY